MEREYFCACCGLFFWQQAYEKRNGMMRRLNVTCPNEECPVYKDSDLGLVFAVDTMGFVYYAESESERIQKIQWSSPRFAHPEAIDIYRKQGILIKEVL
ncbi:hypothetical protein CN526_26545 [Bacillus wiedmannii]|uniref:hypothetical protein n=1 Tax=Bacillus wiedmannii TaxID=1890302 RepID=UPI000BFA79F0|nr:hypothetical protein [Bacillus wiedmannii]PEU21481.1 hypothetical protein CN526_26545 [Bacillus wiedmannii]